MKMVIVLIFIIVLISLLIIGCDEQSKIIFGTPKECLDNGTYCHLFRTSSGGDVNLTFGANGTLDYEVQS